ncbi:MAG: CDP-diacylglycerol--serine O-phosphatidyltransferase [Myxococcota bacterium]
MLPSLFTVSSIFCGFFAIALVLDHPAPHDIYRASLAVFFGLFFDMADGRVARLTRTQSEFGVQLDSLADLVTFGVAPATILYAWAFGPRELSGALLGFAFVAAGALRLARFNVLAAHAPRSSHYFVGLPIPVGAGTLLSLIMLQQRTLAAPPTHRAEIVAFVLVVAYLMVSNVRYRTFKDVRPTPAALATVLAIGVAFLAVAVIFQPTLALLTLFGVYVASGLIESLIRRGKGPVDLPPALDSHQAQGEPRE